MRRIVTPFVLICVICGLLMPKVAMAVAHTAGTWNTITICTGYELKTITLDASGEPVSETTSKSDPCTLSFAFTPLLDRPNTWMPAHYTWVSQSALFDRPTASLNEQPLRPHSRAPPALS